MYKAGKRRYRVVMLIGAAIAIVSMVVCLCVMPADSLVQNIMEQVRIVLKLNDDEVVSGTIKNVSIPSNCEQVEYIGETSKEIEWNPDDLKSDLVYRSVEGGSISLEKGDNVNISAAFGKEYKNVFIYILGKNIIEKIGTLDESTPYSFTAEISGQYVIYAGKEKKNITKEVGIGMRYKFSLD